MELSEALINIGEFWKGVLYIICALLVCVGWCAVILAAVCGSIALNDHIMYPEGDSEWYEVSKKKRKRVSRSLIWLIGIVAALILAIYPALFMIFPWSDPFGRWVS